jgi:hypothetical protein
MTSQSHRTLRRRRPSPASVTTATLSAIAFVLHYIGKSPAFDRASDWRTTEIKSEFCRQIAVDLKTDADLNEDWRIPSHAHSPLLCYL